MKANTTLPRAQIPSNRKLCQEEVAIDCNSRTVFHGGRGSDPPMTLKWPLILGRWFRVIICIEVSFFRDLKKNDLLNGISRTWTGKAWSSATTPRIAVGPVCWAGTGHHTVLSWPYTLDSRQPNSCSAKSIPPDAPTTHTHIGARSAEGACVLNRERGE